LLDGYRTQLNGLSAKEAEALFMAGLSAPAAADLGIGAVMAAAQNKLLSAMPAALRAGAEQMRARFHLDAPAWFAQAERPKHLPLVADAVWAQRVIRIRYQSWKAEKKRVVEPLGLVLKSGAWYLVGRVGSDVRTYRISRVLSLDVLDRCFERPKVFDLASYWQASTQRLEAELHQGSGLGNGPVVALGSQDARGIHLALCARGDAVVAGAGCRGMARCHHARGVDQASLRRSASLRG
jgi:predicted DNA-binding transcriptional regulator YafY